MAPNTYASSPDDRLLGIPGRIVAFRLDPFGAKDLHARRGALTFDVNFNVYCLVNSQKETSVRAVAARAAGRTVP
jgi:hypothetical protein